MLIRKIKPEEFKRTEEIASVVFNLGISQEKSAQELAQYCIATPKTRDEKYFLERWAAFEKDNSTMMGFLVAKPYPVHFDGNVCTMIGIGAVSTLPQYRNKGCIRECFKAALPDMYRQGAAFSYLYPFSTEYYNKFGYGMGCEKIKHRLKLSSLEKIKLDGQCFLAEPGNLMLEEIKQVYKAWQTRFNMMVQNEEYEFRWAETQNPATNKTYTYLYKSKDNTPKSYMTFQTKEDSTGRFIHCTRFVYADTEGLKGLLRLAASFSGDHQHIVFETPPREDMSVFMRELSMHSLQETREFQGMVRVINVAKVLEMAAMKGNGKLVIQVQDEYIPENNQTFSVEFKQGQNNKVSVCNQNADIRLSIQDFSSMIIGIYDYTTYHRKNSVEIENNSQALQNVFYQKPCLLLAYF